MFCKYCGKQIEDHAAVCPYCSGVLEEIPNNLKGTSDQNKDNEFYIKISALFICVFVGYFGVHRFYLGYKNEGLTIAMWYILFIIGNFMYEFIGSFHHNIIAAICGFLALISLAMTIAKVVSDLIGILFGKVLPKEGCLAFRFFPKK